MYVGRVQSTLLPRPVANTSEGPLVCFAHRWRPMWARQPEHFSKWGGETLGKVSREGGAGRFRALGFVLILRVIDLELKFGSTSR